MYQTRLSAGLKQALTDELLEDITQFDRIKRENALKTGVLERYLGEYMHGRLITYPHLDIRAFLNDQLPVLTGDTGENLTDLQAEIRVYKRLVEQLLQRLQQKAP